MACCTPTIFPFANAASSDIPYGPALVQQHGSQPNIFVLYRDADTGKYIYASWFTRIEFHGTSIFVDHGGPQTGLVIVK